MAPGLNPITQLLHEVAGGDNTAANVLYDAIYDELRQIAHGRLICNRPGQTLNTTALVHEAYLRLVDQDNAGWNDRAHFFATASRAMRFILIDYARERMAQKRGGGRPDVSLTPVYLADGDGRPADERAADLLTLNQALDQLMAAHERLGHLVEYKFFGGLTYPEIAEVTGWSVPTIKRDWRRARAWLYRLMQEHES